MKKLDDDFDRTPSLLDRLVDDGMPEPRTGVISRRQAARDLNDTLLIDIEKLLNTRPRCAPIPEHLQELSVSLLNYGLRHFSARDLATDIDRARLVEEIKSVVIRYEPRLSDVNVELIPATSELDRSVKFRILASVRQGAEPV